MAKKLIMNALPQICACILSVLERKSLQTVGLKTWAVLVENLEDEDLTPLIGQTFSIVLYYWTEFDLNAQNIAQMMITGIALNKKRLKAFGQMVSLVPSLSPIPLFAKIESSMKAHRCSLNLTVPDRLRRRFGDAAGR